MLPYMTSRYHDSGIFALGFSAAVMIDAASRVLAAPGVEQVPPTFTRILCGALVGPLIVICLLLKRTIPHRLVLVAGLLALILYVGLGLR